MCDLDAFQAGDATKAPVLRMGRAEKAAAK
jgi:hypothetical protein